MIFIRKPIFQPIDNTCSISTFQYHKSVYSNNLISMEMNWLVILWVSVIAFGLAPIWFWMIFWNIWTRIHWWENKSKEEMKEKQSWIEKLMFIEAVNTIIMVAVLAFVLINTSSYSPYIVAFLLWIAFLFPTTVSGVIWGDDKKEYWLHKIAILSGFGLVTLMISSFLLHMFL